MQCGLSSYGFPAQEYFINIFGSGIKLRYISICSNFFFFPKCPSIFSPTTIPHSPFHLAQATPSSESEAGRSRLRNLKPFGPHGQQKTRVWRSRSSSTTSGQGHEREPAPPQNGDRVKRVAAPTGRPSVVGVGQGKCSKRTVSGPPAQPHLLASGKPLLLSRLLLEQGPCPRAPTEPVLGLQVEAGIWPLTRPTVLTTTGRYPA